MFFRSPRFAAAVRTCEAADEAMGEDIGKTRFGAEEFAEFQKRLAAETGQLSEALTAGAFSDTGFTLGFEVEAWLVDHNFFPSPINEAFLDTLNHPLVVPEISRFNVELNFEPLVVESGVFHRAAERLGALWTHANKVAHGMDANMVAIGTLPASREEDFSLRNMSPRKRYYALNNQILRLNEWRPAKMDIEGEDHFVAQQMNVMLEAAATSFQVHLKPPAALAHRYYNASIAASGPVLAVSTNSPFLFGNALWDETRIPIFEQAVPLTDRRGSHGRVGFGSRYITRSLTAYFEENAKDYDIQLPLLFDEGLSAFRHLRLQNGTIWRWNRALVGFEFDGTPHLRIEHRPLPSGPTIVDMIANTAFYLGLTHHLVEHEPDFENRLPFETARRNFYAAARSGLSCNLDWLETGSISARTLLLDSLLPSAAQGLAELGIEADEIERFLGIVEARVRSGQTGTIWQRRAFETYGKDVYKLMAAYCENQRSGVPVHEWEL